MYIWQSLHTKYTQKNSISTVIWSLEVFSGISDKQIFITWTEVE